MADLTLLDPHITLYIRAKTTGDDEATPPEESCESELRREYNLGWYTAAELDDLLEELGEALSDWVSEHPPHE